MKLQSVVPGITDFDSLDLRWSLCLLTLPVCPFISNRLDYCNAPLCGSLTPCLGSCSQFKMRRPGYSHELADENTLHQPWDNFTGYLSAIKKFHGDWLPPTCKTGAGWPVKWAAADARAWNYAIGVSAAGPRLWNSLPGPLRQSETLTTFKRQLKTFLFSD